MCFPEVKQIMIKSESSNCVPLVSICIPVFNKIKFLSKSINSALAQSYKNIEIIIVDNCSTDGSYELALQHVSNHVKVFRNETNVGMIANWDIALSHASGEYIKILCADDLIHPDTVLKQVNKILELGEEFTLVSGNRTIIDEDDRAVANFKYPYFGMLDGNVMAKRVLVNGKNIIGEPMSCLFRKRDLLGIGGFHSPNTYVVDICAWIKLIKDRKLYIFPEFMGQFRISKDASTTDDGLKQVKKFAEYVLLNKNEFKLSAVQVLWSFVNISKNAILRNIFIKLALR